MNFNSTVKGSALEGFYPAGWDFDKIDACIDAPETITNRQAHWNASFTPIACETLGEFETYMGHEIAMQIKLAKDAGEKIAFILSVGPMGMYKWVVYFLKEWKVSCEHVYTFNMDEWADAEGNTLDANDPGAFQNAMVQSPTNLSSVPWWRMMHSVVSVRYLLIISTTVGGSSASLIVVKPRMSTNRTAMLNILPPRSSALPPCTRSSFRMAGST